MIKDLNLYPKTALIVEDQAVAAMDIQSTLNDCGFINSIIANSGRKAITLLENKPFSFATLDIRLADNVSGIEVGKILIKKNIPFVFISAFSNPENLVLAKELNPLGIFEKPYDRDTFITMLHSKFNSNT